VIHVISKLGKRIRCTARHWAAIIKKHDALTGLEEAVTETLERPHYVRQSKEDERVLLYYAPCGTYFLCVVCRHLNGDGFIITAYLTDRIKKGTTAYETDSDHV
jgi:hypothetical protein